MAHAALHLLHDMHATLDLSRSCEPAVTLLTQLVSG